MIICQRRKRDGEGAEPQKGNEKTQEEETVAFPWPVVRHGFKERATFGRQAAWKVMGTPISPGIPFDRTA
jgi:hypothetical protein